MARPTTPGPTPRELLLLKLLWEHGPSTVREIRKRFPERPKPAYTSLQTNLQAMFEKGLVARETVDRAHVYRAAIGRDAMEQSIVEDLLSRVFDGSSLRLIATALTTDEPSAEELQRLQALIEEKAEHE